MQLLVEWRVSSLRTLIVANMGFQIVALQFVVAWAGQVSDPKIERLAHAALDYCRENDKHEFFRCDVETATRAILACDVAFGAGYEPAKPSLRGNGAPNVGKGRAPMMSSSYT